MSASSFDVIVIGAGQRGLRARQPTERGPGAARSSSRGRGRRRRSSRVDPQPFSAGWPIQGSTGDFRTAPQHHLCKTTDRLSARSAASGEQARSTT